MATYYVERDDTTVDGNTFCDGRKCTSSDTIIIRGGARGNLLLKNFNGNGLYIPIMNEDSASRVVITQSGSPGWAALSLENCSYIDLRGNNSSSWRYGIKVNTTGTDSAIWAYQEGDHVKLSYLESVGDGIGVRDSSLSESSIFDTYEIHHNYIHDTIYSGMYLGMNTPPSNHNPYISNFSVHDNLLEDMGAYGITLKGIHHTSGVCSIYNNTVKRTGLVYADPSNGSFWQGIGVQYYYGTTYADIYNNWIEYTKGPGLKIGDQKHQVHDNIICGCGTANAVKWGNGITTFQSASDVHIYDNIIIQPKRYGIWANGTTISARMSRNLIGDAGVGEWGEEQSGDLTESTGADANIYHADVATFGFKKWSDDGNYSNDDFTFGVADTTPPIVTSFTTDTPLSYVNVPITLNYIVKDETSLDYVELHITTDKSGVPDEDNWVLIGSYNISGTSVSGGFTDYVQVPGTFWYGMYVVDSAGNVGVESSAIKVVVVEGAPISCRFSIKKKILMFVQNFM